MQFAFLSDFMILFDRIFDEPLTLCHVIRFCLTFEAILKLVSAHYVSAMKHIAMLLVWIYFSVYKLVNRTDSESVSKALLRM